MEVFYIMFRYGVVVVCGCFAGYVKRGSAASLAACVGFSGTLLVGALSTWTRREISVDVVARGRGRRIGPAGRRTGQASACRSPSTANACSKCSGRAGSFATTRVAEWVDLGGNDRVLWSWDLHNWLLPRATRAISIIQDQISLGSDFGGRVRNGTLKFSDLASCRAVESHLQTKNKNAEASSFLDDKNCTAWCHRELAQIHGTPAWILL